MTKYWAYVGIALLLLTGMRSGQAQQAESQELQAVKRELEALREGQKRIEQELQAIKELLRTVLASRGAEPREIWIAVDERPSKGDPAAKLLLVEFSDYQ